MTIYADLYRYRELFGSLFRRDLRAKYKGSALGLAWSLAHPLLLAAVYIVVFSVLWRAQVVDFGRYPLFLLSGLGVWVFFGTSLQAASRALLENANLIRKVRFPRQLVPLSIVATQLPSLVVLLVLVAALDLALIPGTRDWAWVAFPLAIPVVALVAGVSLAVASLNVLYRDVEHVVQALLLPWFFLTPVLYRLGDVPGADAHPWLEKVLHYGNFMTPPIEAIRQPLFFGVAPRIVDVVYLLVASVAALALGAFVFTRMDDRVAAEV